MSDCKHKMRSSDKSYDCDMDCIYCGLHECDMLRAEVEKLKKWREAGKAVLNVTNLHNFGAALEGLRQCDKEERE